MHDPLVLIFSVPVLKLDVWHREPHGHDSGEVCGYLPRRRLSRVWFATRHVHHLHLRWWPVFNVRRRITDRCDGCGRRFRWREARHSYMSTDKVWHDVCIYAVMSFNSPRTWRRLNRLKHLDEVAAQQGETP